MLDNSHSDMVNHASASKLLEELKKYVLHATDAVNISRFKSSSIHQFVTPHERVKYYTVCLNIYDTVIDFTIQEMNSEAKL